MSEHIEHCIICGSNDLYLDYMCGHFDYGIFCNGCQTIFTNELYQENKEEIIEWFNSLPRKE